MSTTRALWPSSKPKTASATSSSIPPTNELQWAISLPICKAATARSLLDRPARSSRFQSLHRMPMEPNARARSLYRLTAPLSGLVDTKHQGPEGAEIRTILKYSDEKQRRESLEKAIS